VPYYLFIERQAAGARPESSFLVGPMNAMIASLLATFRFFMFFFSNEVSDLIFGFINQEV